MKVLDKAKQISRKIIDWFLEEPKRLVRLVVLSICSIVVFFQLWECVMKLLHPPISTASHFDLNRTMHYPAVTFCRNPPFKPDVMKKYNLSYHPSITSSWRDFPYELYSLSDVFHEATYSKDEIFGIYALSGLRDNVEVVSTLHFTRGRCFTLKPKVTTDFPWKNAGYSVELKHDHVEVETEQEDPQSSDPPGFHIFLHEPRERFTEHGILSNGRIEYLFMHANEEMELKLTVQHFSQLRGRGSTCSDEELKSLSICTEMCRWKSVEESVSCKGPWMSESNAPQCSNFEDVRDMIVNYKDVSNIDNSICGCVEPCFSVIYSSFVMNRKRITRAEPGSKIFIYYTSKMVTNIVERPGYDFSQFVADMGGSLGFLLGLSVIGLIVVIEKLLGYWFMNKFIENYKAKQKLQNNKIADEKLEKPNRPVP